MDLWMGHGRRRHTGPFHHPSVGGAVADNRIVRHKQNTDGSGTRWSFDDVRPDSWVFRDEETRDGGKTWRLREEDHMMRRGAVVRRDTRNRWLLAGRGAPLIASRHCAHAILQTLAKAPAQPQSNLGFQYDLVVAAGLQFQPMNPVEVHDDRTVYTHELVFVQVSHQLQ